MAKQQHRGPMHERGMETGINFGLTSGVITTLGLMVGLNSGTHSTLAVVGGILTIAIADAMSDALGIHISREADHQARHREIWTATIATFLSKLVMASTFLIPVLLLELAVAVWVSVAWGLTVVTALSYRLARLRDIPVGSAVAEHVFIAAVVVVASHLVGNWVAATFGGSVPG